MYETSVHGKDDISVLCKFMTLIGFPSLILIFEAEIIDEWINPFDSIVLKLLTILVYIVELFASIMMLAFVSFEREVMLDTTALQ